MSKKSIGTGITRLLFGLKGKDLKVIPYNEMSPQQFEQLDSFLGKLGFILASDTYTLTKQQSDYVLNQIKQLDLYRERIMPGTKPDFKDFIPRENLGIPSADKAREFKGFDPKVIEGGKSKKQMSDPTKDNYVDPESYEGEELANQEFREFRDKMKGKPKIEQEKQRFKDIGKINYDKMEKHLGVKLRGDETFDELLEIERKNKIKKFEQDNDRALEDLVDDAGGTKEDAEFDDEPFDAAQGGLATAIAKIKGKYGKKAIMKGKVKKKSEKQKLREMFEAFQKRQREREGFIFGGGVGLKGYLKMLAEGGKTRKGKPMKGSDVLKQGNPKSQVPPAARPFISDRDKSEMKRLRIAQLENVLEGLKSDRQFLESYEKMAKLFPEVNKLSYNMLEDLLPAKHKERFKGLTTEILDKEILQVENVLKNLKVGKDKRSLNADGGRIGFDKGGIFGSGPAPSDVIDSDLLDIGFDNLTLDEIRDILDSIGVDKKAEGGLATMFRPKLKNGGPPNPGRRTFLKLMAGLASLPIVGKLFKPAKIAKTVVPLQNTTTTMPTWFPDFVDKMVTKNVGNKIDADVMLYKDKDLPGVELYKYDDGRINVTGENEYYAQYDIDYTPPGYEVVDYNTGKAVKTKGEFEAVDADPIPDYDGSIGDYEPRVLDDVDEIMSSDARRMEAYATGKSDKEIPIKSGEGRVIENEVRADQAADYARENYDGPEDFAKGGLATMFRKK